MEMLRPRFYGNVDENVDKMSILMSMDISWIFIKKIKIN